MSIFKVRSELGTVILISKWLYPTYRVFHVHSRNLFSLDKGVFLLSGTQRLLKYEGRVSHVVIAHLESSLTLSILLKQSNVCMLSQWNDVSFFPKR